MWNLGESAVATLACPWRSTHRIPRKCVAETPQNYYPRTTDKSPYISNRDTTKKIWVIPQQNALRPYIWALSSSTFEDSGLSLFLSLSARGRNDLSTKQARFHRKKNDRCGIRTHARRLVPETSALDRSAKRSRRRQNILSISSHYSNKYSM